MDNYITLQDMDKSLNEAAADKIRKYRVDYNHNPPDSISFLPVIASTSDRLHSEFIRLLFWQAETVANKDPYYECWNRNWPDSSGISLVRVLVPRWVFKKRKFLFIRNQVVIQVTQSSHRDSQRESDHGLQGPIRIRISVSCVRELPYYFYFRPGFIIRSKARVEEYTYGWSKHYETIKRELNNPFIMNRWSES